MAECASVYRVVGVSVWRRQGLAASEVDERPSRGVLGIKLSRDKHSRCRPERAGTALYRAHL